MSVGDSAFAYSSNVIALQKMNWVWNLFFVTSYFVASAGLFWHNRFFIHDSKEKEDHIALKDRGDNNLCK
jgi:hypothetical protein